MHQYPDGSLHKDEPSDGQIFYWFGPHKNVIGIFQYDGFLTKWYDITHGTPSSSTLDDEMVNVALDLSRPLMQCECGADKLGHPGHDWYCKKFKK